MQILWKRIIYMKKDDQLKDCMKDLWDFTQSNFTQIPSYIQCDRISYLHMEHIWHININSIENPD